MSKQIEDFLKYLEKEREMSKNTLGAYKKDLDEFENFLNTRNKESLMDAVSADMVAFLMELKKKGKTASTLNRKLAANRSFYVYMVNKKKMSKNPTLNIKTPRVEKKDLEYLSMEEISKIFTLEVKDSFSSRDIALLEFMYATGLRVSEVVSLKISDINLSLGFITCSGEFSKPRIIPLGSHAKNAMEEYLNKYRKSLMGKKANDYVFLNYCGEPITRQGLWKILKEYGKKVNLSQSLTPNIIRNSFAVHMLQNGADLKSLQELMGHEDISATQIYLLATKRKIKDVYDNSHPRA